MKRVLYIFAIAALAVTMTSCGSKATGETAETAESEEIAALEGETVDTRFYTIIIPQGWQVKDMKTKDYNLYLKKMKEDLDVDALMAKGDGLMNISVATVGLDDEMVKAIIDNIVIKETAGPKAEVKEEEITYKTEPGKKGFTRYFFDKGVSVELPDNVLPRKGAKNIFDEQDQKYNTVYSVTVTTLSDHFNQDEYMKSRTESMQKMRKDTKVTKNGKNFDMTYSQNTTITVVEHHVTTPEKAAVVRIMYWNTGRDDHPEKYVKDVFNSVKMD